MFKYYDIIDYKKDTGELTFRFNNNIERILTVDIENKFPNYKPCYDYYFTPLNKLERIVDSNGEKEVYKNGIKYRKCYQYEYDKYFIRYPNDPNGQLYKYLESIYTKLFK